MWLCWIVSPHTSCGPCGCGCVGWSAPPPLWALWSVMSLWFLGWDWLASTQLVLSSTLLPRPITLAVGCGVGILALLSKLEHQQPGQSRLAESHKIIFQSPPYGQHADAASQSPATSSQPLEQSPAAHHQSQPEPASHPASRPPASHTASQPEIWDLTIGGEEEWACSPDP